MACITREKGGCNYKNRETGGVISIVTTSGSSVGWH